MIVPPPQVCSATNVAEHTYRRAQLWQNAFAGGHDCARIVLPPHVCSATIVAEHTYAGSTIVAELIHWLAQLRHNCGTVVLDWKSQGYPCNVRKCNILT